jgi:hypothetical protein
VGTFGGATLDALSPDIGLAFPITVGSSDSSQSVSTRATLDQPSVETQLKDKMKDSEGWNAAHQAGYADLTFGIPLVPNIIFNIADQVWDLTPLSILPLRPSDVFNFISSLPILSSIIPGLDASKIISGQFPLEMISGLLDSGGKIFTSLLTVPVSVITGLGSFVAEAMQDLIDTLVNAIFDTPGHTGNPLSLLFTGMNGLAQSVALAHDVVDNLSNYFQDMGSLLVQIVQQLTERPVLGFVGNLMNALSFWVFGWFHRTETAHTAQNAGIATLRGEMNAKFADVATGTTGWTDDFQEPGYSLTTNYTVNNGEASSVLGTRTGSTNVVLKPPTSTRASMYYDTEMTTGQVDVEMAISNLAQKGRCALWIGGHSASLAGGLDSGTLLVRIDNGFSDSSKQRLQIYTVSITGTQNSHGNLYSVDIGTWHDGDLIRLRKDETTKIHRVFLNDVEVCTYDDHINNVVTVGAGSRFGGWRQNIDSSSGPSVGPDLDLIHLYDWVT